MPAAQPDLKHSFAAWGVPKEIRQLLRDDRELFWAIVVVAIFWMVGGIVLPTVNALGKTQLGLDDWRTSVLTASIGVGIAVGCMLGGYLSRGRVNRTVVIGGAIGAVVTLLVMALPGRPERPLARLLRQHPRADSRRTVQRNVHRAGASVAAIAAAARREGPHDRHDESMQLGRRHPRRRAVGSLRPRAGRHRLAASTFFAVTALLMLPVALFYRPQDERLADVAS